MAAVSQDFQWPWQYTFPPFFTIQPNSDTKAKQLDAWCSLVLDYFKCHKLYRLDVTESSSMPLFHNKDISRQLSSEGVLLILDELCKRGNVEWENPKQKARCFVYWRTPEEWASIVFKWVQDNGLTDTVCTLFELINGDDSQGQDFHSIDIDILRKALKVLETKGKAQIFTSEDPNDEGLKFFS